MARYHWLFSLLFGLLASLKFLIIVRENGLSAIFSAVMYMALFGSPQIFWLFQYPKPICQSQTVISICVLVAFVMSSLYFGYFPGSGRPSWGGEPHWEVPAAFVVEWATTGVAYLLFWLFRSKATNA